MLDKPCTDHTKIRSTVTGRCIKTSNTPRKSAKKSAKKSVKKSAPRKTKLPELTSDEIVETNILQRANPTYWSAKRMAKHVGKPHKEIWFLEDGAYNRIRRKHGLSYNPNFTGSKM